MKKLDFVLKELEDADVIEEVSGRTEWVSNLVLTPKVNTEEIRMDIDRRVNVSIKRT